MLGQGSSPANDRRYTAVPRNQPVGAGRMKNVIDKSNASFIAFYCYVDKMLKRFAFVMGASSPMLML